MHDYNAVSVATFDKNASKYAEKYFSLRDYDQYYQLITAEMPKGNCRFLDLACGPGNVAAFVRERRPQAEILCVDSSLQMLWEAQARVPGITVKAADCRDLSGIDARFDAAAFFFGLSYFNDADAATVLSQMHGVMRPGSLVLLATVAGDPSLTGVQVNGAGERVFSFYRTQEEIEHLFSVAGFAIIHSATVSSPANASVQSTDIVLLGRRCEIST